MWPTLIRPIQGLDGKVIFFMYPQNLLVVLVVYATDNKPLDLFVSLLQNRRVHTGFLSALFSAQ